MHWLREYEGPRGVAYALGIVTCLGPSTIAVYLLQPALLTRLAWPMLLLLSASTGSTVMALCLLGAVLAVIPGGDKPVPSKERGRLFRGSLVLAFSTGFIVEIASLAISTKQGGDYAAYVRTALQFGACGLILLPVMGYFVERSEASAKSKEAQ